MGIKLVNRTSRFDVPTVMIGQLVQLALTFVTSIIIARFLHSDGYGVYNILRSIFVWLATLAPLGLDVALLKYCGRFPPDAPHVLQAVLRLRLIALAVNSTVAVSIGLGLGGILMRDVYPYDGFDRMLFITLLGLPLAADIAIMGAVYKARGEAGRFALMTLYLQPIVRVVLVLCAAAFAPTLFAVVCINTIQVALSALAILTHQFHRNRVRKLPGRSTVPSGELTTVLVESLWMSLSLAVYGMMRVVDILMLGSFASAKEVGAYAALSAISQLVQIYPLAASQALGPTVSRNFHNGDLQGVRGALQDYLHYASIAGGFIFAGIAAFGDRLDLVFGPSFHFRPDVSFVMPFGYLVSATLAPMGFALSMTGRHKAELAISCIGGALLVTLCGVLIPSLNQLGAALSVSSAFLAINVIRYLFISRIFGFLPGTKRDFLPPLAALAIAFFTRFLIDCFSERSLAPMVLACVLYSLAYGLLCFSVLLRKETRAAIAGSVIQHLPGRASLPH